MRFTAALAALLTFLIVPPTAHASPGDVVGDRLSAGETRVMKALEAARAGRQKPGKPNVIEKAGKTAEGAAKINPPGKTGDAKNPTMPKKSSPVEEIIQDPPVAPPVEPVRLETALGEVLATHPRVLEKLKEYNAAAADQSRASSAFRGSVDVEGEAGWEEMSNSSSKFTGRDARVSGARVVGRRLVDDGNRTRADLAAREALTRSALFDYLDAANQIAFETVEAYLTLLKAAALMSLAEESVETHRKILESIKARVSAGAEGQSELQRVQGRLAAAQAQLIGRQNDYKRAVFTLKKYVGTFVEGEEMVRPVFLNEQLPASLDAALARQDENHPALVAADFNIDVKRWERERQHAEYRPVWFAEASRDWRNDYSAVNGFENDARAMLKMRYNLWDGGARADALARATSLVHRETEIRDRVHRNLHNDLELTWTSYKLLDSQIGAVRQNIVYTKEALNSYKEEFKVGRRLLINILDAENEFQAARAQLAAAKYDLLLVKYRLLHSMGTLVEDLGLAVPLAAELKAARRMRPATRDRMPCADDLDGDSYKNKRDLAMNTKRGAEVNALGVEPAVSAKYLEDPREQYGDAHSAIRDKADLQMRRFRPDVQTEFEFISFERKSVELSAETKKVMREVVNQLRAYALDGIINITVGTREMADERENRRLALERAYNIKKILVVHGLEPEAIMVYDEPHCTNENTIMFKIVTETGGMRKAYESLSRDKVRFDKGKETLTAEAKGELAKLAEELRRLGHPPVDVVVYSNDADSPSKNRQLSARRAEAVAAFLAGRGVPADGLVPIAWGDYDASQDLYDNTDEIYFNVPPLPKSGAVDDELTTEEVALLTGRVTSEIAFAAADARTGETVPPGGPDGVEIAGDEADPDESATAGAGGLPNPPRTEPKILNKVEFVLREVTRPDPRPVREPGRGNPRMNPPARTETGRSVR